MRISQILNKKGSGVITVPATSTVRGLLATLDEWNIGAVLVVGDGGAIAGIASERDVVRCLHTGGASILDRTAFAAVASHCSHLARLFNGHALHSLATILANAIKSSTMLSSNGMAILQPSDDG